MSEWISVKDMLPESGKVVLMFCENWGRFKYICVGRYIGKYQEEADCEFDGNEDYNEEEDAFYYPAGWTERIVNWDEYREIYVEGRVISWMPLPEFPEVEHETD